VQTQNTSSGINNHELQLQAAYTAVNLTSASHKPSVLEVLSASSSSLSMYWLLSCRNITGAQYSKLQNTKRQQAVAGLVTKGRMEQNSLQVVRDDISDGAFLMEGRRLFHARAEATGKARSPSVEWSEDNTASVAVSAERRWWRAH